MGRVLFGTDGIRGLAGTYPLDSKTAHAVGDALGKLIAKSGQEQQVILGMDTRESGSHEAERIVVAYADKVTPMRALFVDIAASRLTSASKVARSSAVSSFRNQKQA